MPTLKFYEVNKSYVDFLRQYDSKIPNIAYSGRNDKFICGTLFEINGRQYFAPISSFTKQQKTNILIKNNDGRTTSSIRMSFMFPAPMDQLQIKDFSKEDPSYRRLLEEEYRFCRRNAEKIIDRAEYIYQAAVSGKDPIIQRNCCDFKKLEDAYDLFVAQRCPLKIPVVEKEEERGDKLSMPDRLAAATAEADRRNAGHHVPDANLEKEI